MALFSKPPVKKPAAVRPADPPRATPARELAAQSAGRKGANARPAEPHGGNTLTGASLIDWSHAYASIEVADTNPGLCTVLENAALFYGGGQAEPARAALEEGVQNDHDTKISPLAWLALFDLLQRANQRTAFDQLALQYVVQFERSAPAWEEPEPAAVEPNPSSGGYVALAGKLTAVGHTQLLILKRAIDKRLSNARLDLGAVISFDDAGAHMLADLLAQGRRHRLGLAIERPEKLAMALDAALKKGRDGGQGAWLLALELLQWQHDQAAFDDRAVDYAVAFEVSPPSWEPPPRPEPKVAPAAEAPAKPATDTDVMVFAGVMSGPNVPQVAAFADYAIRRTNVVAVDMTAVERIDFVCAGAFLNAISRTEGQRKTVQITGASPIIRAMLLLIGVSPRHFVKKSA
jgi:anti-anti-sigma regulatory factor